MFVTTRCFTLDLILPFVVILLALLSGREDGLYEPRHEKTCIRGLRPGKTEKSCLRGLRPGKSQTGLRSHKS